MEWYKKQKKELLEYLKTSLDGLSNKEANDRLNKYGKNTLPKKKNESIINIFFKQMLDPIVMLLIITIIFSFAVGEIIDAIAIIFIVFVDLIVGTIQEWKASKDALALSKLIKVKTKVIRDGKELEIDSEDVVIGDIVLLESGNKVSADLRILSCSNLQIDESVLTGESISVLKQDTVIKNDVTLSERNNMIYAGTSVVTGRAKCVVVATGIDTEIGLIAKSVNESKEEKSPLTIRMEKFSKQITLLIIIVAILITLLLIYKGQSGNEIFLSVIALSISAMPEGLPLALTLALTIASRKMSKKNVIVKKLNSVESLGSCTVIASDKTGTLTVNEQTARKIVLPFASYDVTGTGYNNKGEIISNNDILNSYNIIKLGLINNEAHFEIKGKKYLYYGDSIDIAFKVLASKADIKEDLEIVGRIPYESEAKFSAVFYKLDNKIHCTVKGSIEKILEFSNKMRKNNAVNIDKDYLLNQNEELAKQGYRVIAIADGVVDDFKSKPIYTKDDIPMLIFEGMVAFIDPIREEAKKAISECKTAGIKVLMITGDHPLTAYSIAKDLEILNYPNQLANSDEVSKYYNLGLDEFDEFISQKTVFTRVTPIQKLQIIESLKRQGEFVAVTGDGVNDAPAIKAANIGISLGSGTDVAKETSSMLIIDDNFNSIVEGIKEGRNAYSNIRKISYLLLSCGLAEVLFFVLAIFFDMPMPLVTIQLLWLNLVTDGLQDMSLSFEKSEKSIMKDKPRSTKETIFDKEMLLEVLLAGLVIGLLVFGVWYYLIEILNYEVTLARGYIMTLMVFIQNIHVLNCRSEKSSVFEVPLFSNPLLPIVVIVSILLQIAIMEIPFLSNFLQTESIPYTHMSILFVLSLSILLVMETYKNIKKSIKR